MLENCNSIKERWGGVSKILDNWFQQRQALIVDFCTVSGVHGVNLATQKDTGEQLRHFCELLVDYVSAGHFEVYDHLIQEAEELNDGKGMEVARRLYPQISQTTEHVLAFNDRVETLAEEGFGANLANALSKLGETLVLRFELEDQLVENLHYAHEDMILSA
jgi:regulator of sigma D